jgi:hypothetical protein
MTINKPLPHHTLYMYGDYSGTTCITDLKGGSVDYPASISETASDFELNHSIWADQRGFAINFDRVKNIYRIIVQPISEDRYNIVVPGLASENLDATYQTFTLFGLDPTDGEACVVFDRDCVLFVPELLDTVESLRSQSFDLRPSARKIEHRGQEPRL